MTNTFGNNSYPHDKSRFRRRGFHSCLIGDTGQGLIELALTLPFLMFILLGAAEFARFGWAAIETANAARAGVQYVEVRALDVSAFDPVGVNQSKLRFVEAFLALCVLKDSAPIDAADEAVLDGNHVLVAHRGREPGLKLSDDGRQRGLTSWALELLDEARPVGAAAGGELAEAFALDRDDG